MSVGAVVLVALAGGLGSALRHVVGRRLDGPARGLPWGTLLVNLVGSVLLGFLVRADLAPTTLSVLGVGLCGGLTTYSAFAVQTVTLRRDAGRGRAAAYALVTVAGCLAAAGLGWALARLVTGTS